MVLTQPVLYYRCSCFLEKNMTESTMLQIRSHLDSIISFLNPLLPLANSHMVEFFTHNHWERLVPDNLKKAFENYEIHDAVSMFGTSGKEPKANCEVSKWINKSRQNCITANSEYCITKEQLEDRIINWGGEIKNEIKVTEFMNSKKSYEVQTMSKLVASLHSACSSTCCVEAGGGRGHLPVALTLGYAIPSLTIDCDAKTITSAAERVKVIQKQWHAIAKKVKDGSEERVSGNINKGLHRFASTFITKNTDLSEIAKENFPEHADKDMKILLTGLHTCGNLGPDSLRIFTSQQSTAAVFNVPCCYHLLTEAVDVEFFDVFQKDYGNNQISEQGFPVSEHLRGYNLGRNARMLAAHSFDRVVHLKQLPAKSLLFRALLQVLIKKHLPNVPVSDGKLKRIGDKCHDFKQYFKMADQILNLELYDVLPNGYVTDFCRDIDSQWKKVVCFYLLRICLAQVIESVILLDRLLYLFENGFDNVYLVKLFDPVLSPRCHSIVAVR